MSIDTTGFIFDLGIIDVSAAMPIVPAFDAVSRKEITGDILLQFNWSRLGLTGADPVSGTGNKYTGVNDNSGMQGDWFNCFLFNVDANDISDANAEDIEYHTVRANWCGHSITRALNNKWQLPSTHGGNDGDAATYGASGDLLEDGTGKGNTNFILQNVGGVTGNYNLPKTSQITGYDYGVSGSLDRVEDSTTHLNLAGEFMRHYSAKMFGGRLRYGLDIFSNEGKLINAVKNKDVSLNYQVLVHLETSNTTGINTGGGDERHANTNIPHVLLSQLLSDPSGAERVRNTLSKPTYSNIPTTNTAITDASDGNNFAPSRTVDVTATTDNVQHNLTRSPAGTVTTSDHNHWYRVPLKEGDKLRIKVNITEDNTEQPSSLAVDAKRTYIIEYLLKD